MSHVTISTMVKNVHSQWVVACFCTKLLLNADLVQNVSDSFATFNIQEELLETYFLISNSCFFSHSNKLPFEFKWVWFSRISYSLVLSIFRIQYITSWYLCYYNHNTFVNINVILWINNYLLVFLNYFVAFPKYMKYVVMLTMFNKM